MSYYSDNRDPEIYEYDAQGRLMQATRGTASTDDASEAASKLALLYRHDPAAAAAVTASLDRELVRLNLQPRTSLSAVGPRRPAPESDRAKIARLCGSAPGELEAWEAARLSDEGLVASIPRERLQALRAFAGSDTARLAAAWRDVLAREGATATGAGRALARLSWSPLDGRSVR